MKTMTHNDVKAEYDRRKSQVARMLEAFKAKGELTTRDLQRIGTGCSTRLFELRKEGHVINAVYERPGMYRYIYLGERDENDANVSSVE